MTSPRAGASLALRCALPGLLLAALALLPFLGKAYTIDDSTFLLCAEHALRDPLHPTAFEMPSGGTIIRVSRLMVNGPVMAYLLVPAALLHGAEWAAHAVQLALFCLAIVGTCALALRLGLSAAQARWAGALVAATPAALVLASTAMSDTPALCFGVLGMERLYAWRQTRRPGAGAWCAALLALAALSRPHLGLLIGVAGLALLEDAPLGARPFGAWLARSWPRFLPILGAAALTLLVIRLTADPAANQRSILHAAKDVSGVHLVRRNLTALFGHFTMTVPLAIPWLLIRWRRLLFGPILGLAIVTAGALQLGMDPPGVVLWMAPVAGLGLAALADILVDALRRRDRVQLVLWAWLLLSLPVVTYVHLPAKYVGASAPAAALIVVRALARGRSPGAPEVADGTGGSALLGAATAVGLGLGLLIIQADARLAGFTRLGARQLIPAQTPAGHKVWFDGGWGFRWYALKAGAEPLATGRPTPQPGDLLVTAKQDEGALWLVPNRRLVRRLSDATPGGRVMSRAAGAGFYSNHPAFGYLPWAWGSDPIESIALWEIVDPARR